MNIKDTERARSSNCTDSCTTCSDISISCSVRFNISFIRGVNIAVVINDYLYAFSLSIATATGCSHACNRTAVLRLVLLNKLIISTAIDRVLFTDCLISVCHSIMLIIPVGTVNSNAIVIRPIVIRAIVVRRCISFLYHRTDVGYQHISA